LSRASSKGDLKLIPHTEKLSMGSHLYTEKGVVAYTKPRIAGNEHVHECRDILKVRCGKR
jgi:hypothetical protein